MKVDRVAHLELKTTKNRLTFRYAVATNNEKLLTKFGRDYWLDDMSQDEIDMSWMHLRDIMLAYEGLYQLAIACDSFNNPMRLKGLNKATRSRMMALGYTTYRHIVRKVYNTEVKIAALDNERQLAWDEYEVSLRKLLEETT